VIDPIAHKESNHFGEWDEHSSQLTPFRQAEVAEKLNSGGGDYVFEIGIGIGIHNGWQAHGSFLRFLLGIHDPFSPANEMPRQPENSLGRRIGLTGGMMSYCNSFTSNGLR
jgi:hypothetical protein